MHGALARVMRRCEYENDNTGVGDSMRQIMSAGDRMRKINEGVICMRTASDIYNCQSAISNFPSPPHSTLLLSNRLLLQE